MKTCITKIGNSKGLIIPAHILKECGFGEEVSLQVMEHGLFISKAQKPRAGWGEAFRSSAPDSAPLLMNDIENTFDRDEWTW